MIDAQQMMVECFRLNQNGIWELYNYGEKDELNFTSVELSFPIEILYEDVVLEEQSSRLGEAIAPPNRYLCFSPNKWEISIFVGFRYLNPTYILTNYGERDEVNFTSVELSFPIDVLYEDVVLEEQSSRLGEAIAPPNRYLWVSPNKWEISIRHLVIIKNKINYL